MSAQSRRWCFTSFDVPDPSTVEEGDDAGELVQFDSLPGIKYLAWQLELSPSGRIHQQGYLITDIPRRLSWFQKEFDTVHWEPARGSHDECVAYVTKEDTRVSGPFIEGVPPPGQGARTDIHEVAAYVMANPNLQAVASAHPVAIIRYPSGIKTLIQTQQRGERGAVTVHVLTGASGLGKSSWPIWLHKDMSSVYILQDETATWWPDYKGEKVILIDDFVGKIPFPTLLRILDRFPFSCPQKGTSTWLQATEIWITSNTIFEMWMMDFYPKDLYRREALERRIHHIYHLPTTPPPGFLTPQERYGDI